MKWTRERLEDTARIRLGERRLVVVANREPYIHTYDGEEVRCIRPASGLTTALDPVMRASGGTWVAHGSGDADRVTSDEAGRVAVPPEDPAYTIRRVWLSRQEEQGYYYGFSNEAMWPLCHTAYTRPRFSSSDWEEYRRVNRKFAEATLEEVAGSPAVVFVQDYHFALLPRMLKEARPDLVVIHFWHIPWPNREIFRVCPWGDEILDGLLGNDLLAFHIQYHCNNFMDTVDRAIEARVDTERFAVTRGGHVTLVRPHPISINPAAVEEFDDAEMSREAARLRKKYRLKGLPLLVGVDRIDYTKGIPDRYRAVDRLLEKYPRLNGRFALVQVGAPSRTHIPEYRKLGDELEALAEEINWRHGTDGWKPIVHVNEHFDQMRVNALYRTAAACVVSSLHDGMNLVAKEFVAARTDLRGALVLSKFTGASRELTDALLINPYSADDFADALLAALEMAPEEQEARMRRMRAWVEEHNVFRWAGHLLSEATRLADSRQLVIPTAS